jgi:hypothetical protein
MNGPPDGANSPPTPPEQLGIEAAPDHLNETEANLVRGLERALADGRLDMATFGHIDLNGLARRLAARSEAPEPSDARPDRWMRQLSRRLRRVESRLAALASQAAAQQESIAMICTILKARHDPYGAGLGADGRLARDEADRVPEER